MRGRVAEFHLETATSLADAAQRLARAPGKLLPLAGGTDVMVLLEAGHLNGRRWLGINRLAELRGIRVSDDAVEIGALTTYTDVQHHPVMRAEFPALVRAASETGGLAIQNRGTVGGNIANASPAADTPPALLVHDAEVKLVSVRGERWLPYEKFHLGYKRTALAPDELIAAVRMRRPHPELTTFYRKVGTRKAQAISKVVLAAAARKNDGILSDVRLALGSVAPTTVRCARAEALLEGKRLTHAVAAAAVLELQAEIAPIDDIRSTAAFRLQVAGNVLASFLATLA